MKRKYRQQYPELSVLSFDIVNLLEEEKSKLSTLEEFDISIWIRRQKTLAFIQNNDNKREISLHTILNHPYTPESVIRFIIKHH